MTEIVRWQAKQNNMEGFKIAEGDKPRIATELRELHIKDGLDLFHWATSEFPLSDGWSVLMQEAIRKPNVVAACERKMLFGIGIGDARCERLARNCLIQAKKSTGDIIGVDIEPGRLTLAYENLRMDEFFYDSLELGDVRLYQGDAVGLSKSWGQFGKESFSGMAFICLPQAKEEGTEYGEWGQYGLSLNAGVLTELKKVSTPNARALLVLSGRLPPSIRQELIRQTGWGIIGIEAEGRVRQDEDTPLDWMVDLADDGYRFFDGDYHSLSIIKAVEMHERGMPVYHDVFVYQVGPEVISSY